MIISPPFLPERNTAMTDANFIASAMPVSAVNCPNTSIPEGSFPVSLNMGWHGGTHLRTPATANNLMLPIRAIADGEIVFAHKPTAQLEDPDHPLNYNPYGDRPAWTDDGFVIIKHTTDIGEGENAQAIVYYSLIAHLSLLQGNALKVAKGVATNPAAKKIYRKDEIGMAGRIYGTPAHVHMEILCDDDNLKKLIGRNPYDDLDTSVDGRTDAVYGEIYFKLPIGTKLYAAKPADNVTTPHSVTPIKTLDAVHIIGLRYAAGDAAEIAHRGDAHLTTYLEDGSIVGAGAMIEAEAEYKLYTRAMAIHKTYHNAHTRHAANATPNHTATPVETPAPSAIYELLRFGRIINTAHETLTPANTPHWRKVRHDGGEGWVNLNTEGISKFSDADFPPWKGWRFIHDDMDDDSRSNSDQLHEVIQQASDVAEPLTRSELKHFMHLPKVRNALSKTICNFPSEWNQDSMDARWGWLKTDPEYKLESEYWELFKKHVAALTYSASTLPDLLSNAHWHFNPQQFITQFRQCGWLSEGEFAQCFPKKLLHLTKAKFQLGKEYEWKMAINTAKIWNIPFNTANRKYGISSSKQRLVHYFSHVIPETGLLRLMKEGDSKDGSYLKSQRYYPYYGRGLIQLTWLENYQSYGNFKGFSKTIRTEQYSDLGWNPDLLIALNNSNYNAANCADSGSFYLAKTLGMLKSIDNGITQADAVEVSKYVNGNVAIENLNGLDVRLQSILFLRDALLDKPAGDNSERLVFSWRRNSEKEATLNKKGKSVKRYILTMTPWVINAPLDKQRP